MSRRVFAALAVIVAVAAAGGSTAALAGSEATKAPRSPKGELTFYLVAGIATDAFYLTMKKGAEAEAKKHGIKLVFTGSPKAFSPPTQIPYLNAAIARKPDAILIAPTDKTALIAPIRNAIKAGIPVATVDTFITAPIAFTNVSTDNVAGGRAAAKALAGVIGKKGTVAGVSVNPGISTTDQRQQGFESELKKYPGIKYVGTQYCNDDQTKAAQITAGLITRYGSDLKGIFAMNVVSGNGVTAAVKNAGKSGQVKLVEFDAGPEQVTALRTGTISALVAQYPYGIGQLGIRLAHRYVTGDRAGIKKHYGTGSAVITKANLNDPEIKKFIYSK
jgi:ribose transport system substrate-binding protein